MIKTKIINFLLFSAIVMCGMPALAHGAAADTAGGKQDAAAPVPSSQKLEAVEEEEYYPDDPFVEMRQMQHAMNRMFNHMLYQPATTVVPIRDSFFSPRLDTYETANAFVVECDLPGMEKDKIDISVSNSVLTISGLREKKAKQEEKKEGYVSYQESVSYGQFSRSMRLPDYIDTTRHDATLKNGVLKIEFPKKKAEEKKIKINIK
jgi:HSP20 family protein